MQYVTIVSRLGLLYNVSLYSFFLSHFIFPSVNKQPKVACSNVIIELVDVLMLAN